MKRNLVSGVVGLCLLIGGIAWATGWFDGEDAEVVALREEFENREQMTEEDREALRGRVQSLDDNQRQQLFEPMMQARMAQMQTRYQNLMAMDAKQRRAELDKLIDEIEQRRSSGQGRFGPGGGFGRPPGGGGEMTEAQRAQRGKERLDRTTPEMRATMTQMMKMINDRREQRGMDPIGPPR